MESGDREDNYSNKAKSQRRCHIKKDASLTHATQLAYCVIFVSPLPEDAALMAVSASTCRRSSAGTRPRTHVARFEQGLLCARQVFDDRSDMGRGGVGTFTRQNRTLYLGCIKETGAGPETEEVVNRDFKEWDKIEHVSVLQNRSVAFVTYVSEHHTQFSKEAMARQSLDNDEI
ncbi:hypothetical protein BJV77DRAFT_60658 [Russula vinacea]|nr:hypothetical protein BJV77DRAFT_60658 [Russula vinacea]